MVSLTKKQAPVYSVLCSQGEGAMQTCTDWMNAYHDTLMEPQQFTYDPLHHALCGNKNEWHVNEDSQIEMW